MFIKTQPHQTAVSIFVTLVLVICSTGMAAEVESFDERAKPFLAKYCLSCHNEETQEGDFRIDSLSRDFVLGADAELWAEVLGRINGGEMPPEDEPQPSIDETEAFVGWIAGQLKSGEAARMARRSPVEHYRLNREEYANTIYDLLGVHYDTKAPGAFTDDPEWHGFTRLGSLLSLSPSHVEKYLKAADVVLDSAYPDRPPKVQTWRKDALDIDWPNRYKREQLKEEGILDQVRTLIWPGHRLTYVGPAHGGHEFSPGIYRARMQISGLKPIGGRPPHVALYSKELGRMLHEQDVLAPEKEPTTIEFETFLAGKLNVTINNEVPGPSNSGRAGRPTGQFVFTTLDNPKSRAPWQRKMTDDEGNPLYPFLIFDWIEWEGPIIKEHEAAKRALYFPQSEGNMEEVHACLLRFAEAAWRRPVSDVELQPYIELVSQEQAAGEKFRSAYKAAMLGILASSNFYYLSEGSAGEVRSQINDWELATRLSYFLWNSMPDDELFTVAKRGELSQPAVLRSQLQRMLADSKIKRFYESFPYQWLQLHKVGMFPPDQKMFPDYDPWLETSMIQESRAYFREMFEQNLPLDEFLDSNWTMLNPRLALHYDIDGINKSGFQRIQLNKDTHRGGLLTHAGILSMTSDGQRHRPVHRGVWVSEAIFGRTPPPPPANVDPIEPNPLNEPKATIRMKLEAHVHDPNCAACHRKIDPLGFAFDNFDAIGRYRTEEEVPRGKGKNPAVNATGALPDGRPFSGPDEFKNLLAEDSDRFAHTFIEKLATYALRRTLTFDDQTEIEAIVEQTKSSDFRVRDMLASFVMSDLFQQR
ncbi:DUF1592 domain-containing protein [Calycomorphotria hydatis]|uniref:Planctomycete cytochrome C n=1 Tax=Calycomorphotria hydatis TaxID=2528027 RepID=A0A517TAS3_9PLAN|nr:DUF1592 domain-containing protein [Calycomorphotria hydatis]QDT65473.1 Planctomycete cytochrome C [Calycomorphotria hydatis]